MIKLLELCEVELNFVARTSRWMAYERWVESQRENKLFYDPLS